MGWFFVFFFNFEFYLRSKAILGAKMNDFDETEKQKQLSEILVCSRVILQELCIPWCV